MRHWYSWRWGGLAEWAPLLAAALVMASVALVALSLWGWDGLVAWALQYSLVPAP